MPGPLASQKRCALGINAEWQDERGGALASVLDPRSLLARALRSADLSKTLCARFIDPYGNAVFNQTQIPILLHELRNLCHSISHEEAKDHLTQVVSLVARAQGETHTYIKFIGD